MRKFSKAALSILGALILMAVQSGCGQSTAKEPKGARLASGPLVQGGTTGGNPALTTFGIAPYSGPAGRDLGIRSLSFCVTRARFVPDSGNVQTVELRDLGEIPIVAGGTPLKSIQLPEGKYRIVILDLEDECGKMKSVQLVNPFGTFRTSDDIQLVFTGNYLVREGGGELWLDLGVVLDLLLDVRSGDALDDAMETVEGRLDSGTSRRNSGGG
jgi:hypothetical protein